MKLTKGILSAIMGLMLLSSCSSSNDAVENGDRNTYGYTRSDYYDGMIPVELKNISDLPDWMQTQVKKWSERDAIVGRFKIFEGKWYGETIYFFDNMLSSCIGCLFYHHDGRGFDSADWDRVNGRISWDDFTDWKCIYSAAPFISAITGTMHFDPDRSKRDDYVANDNKRYYLWGLFKPNDLEKYNGKTVQIGGFSFGDITEIIKDTDNNLPEGITCYGIENTYIRVVAQ